MLDGVSALVDEPVRLIVLIDEHVGTEVAVECPSILERSAHDIARRRHRLGLQREFTDHRDRHVFHGCDQAFHLTIDSPALSPLDALPDAGECIPLCYKMIARNPTKGES